MEHLTVYIPIAIFGLLLFGVMWWGQRAEKKAEDRRAEKKPERPRLTFAEGYCLVVYRVGCSIVAHAKAADRYFAEYKAVRSRDRWKPMHRGWLEHDEAA